MAKCVGILTAGGDSPGLNAAIRAIGKILNHHNYRLIGFRDGFEGIAFDRTMMLEEATCSGILTVGGTILRTSRNKPNKMPVGRTFIDMSDAILENYRKHQLEGLICIGGGGTHKSALLLKKAGMNIVTLPKTIDNDVALTDTTIGFDTALDVATSAIDSLHSTASSHKRIMLVEIMGHRAGWLTLGSGLAGGADVILIPEIPYDINKVAETLLSRSREGKLFSIVPVAEGAYAREKFAEYTRLLKRKEEEKDKKAKAEIKAELVKFETDSRNKIFELARQLEALTGLETRVTILGHLQRGGKPSCCDRLLATRLGSACAEAVLRGQFGMMVAVRGQETELVPIEAVAGRRKVVPADHAWMNSARELGVGFGD
ncbi:6-phosphofructokinase [Victivallis sp. Marseille-Q1083]|uniref:6-phosphofructokinase n=1 Tax=Victivallis sp. Marseille-Q1083 TaxID=2717288 RepID=UPI00158F56D0|nr:ATP-dependent 6-phosphofructokinase [Victivallis sp. Marseille-Q1083]